MRWGERPVCACREPVSRKSGWQNLAKFGDAFSSTAQDLARGKRTEIESLNGYIVRRGAELGVATPSNFALYALVKVIEDKAARTGASAAGCPRGAVNPALLGPAELEGDVDYGF